MLSKYDAAPADAPSWLKISYETSASQEPFQSMLASTTEPQLTGKLSDPNDPLDRVTSSRTTTPSTMMSIELPFQPSPNESYISSVQVTPDPGL